jgi:sugar/nucleoside kinase (ribokinase family)
MDGAIPFFRFLLLLDTLPAHFYNKAQTQSINSPRSAGRKPVPMSKTTPLSETVTIRRGICTAGNMIADTMYRVPQYPARGELTTIQGAPWQTVGGLACNTALSLAMLDSSLPITVCGRIGDDPNGERVLRHFGQHPNIDTAQVLADGETAYTLIIQDTGSGERTFFTSPGSGRDFDVDDVNLAQINARIFHAGYILLLDALDREDGEYGTRMARLLAQARQRGMKTSIDVVSEAGDRHRRLVPPALRHTDYCIINEYEAQQVTGISLRADGRLIPDSLPAVLKALRSHGVAVWPVIHYPEGACGLDETDAFVSLPSLKLPEGYIHSTTGAGDAFCAGVLYGAHEGWALIDALRLGTASAACSLGGQDTSSAIKTAPEALAFYRDMGGE